MPQRLTAGQLIQAIKELGIEPSAAFKLIEIVYITPQEEVIKAKQMLQGEGQPQQGDQPQQEGGEEQVLQQVAQLLQQGTPPEQVEGMLQEQGATPEQAKEIVSTIMAQLQQRQGGAESESEPRV